MNLFNVFFIFVILILNSCSPKNNEPEEVVREFINYRFKENQTKEGIIKFLMGDMKNKIEEMNETDFSEFVNVDGLRKKNLNFIITKCENSICYVTYTLGYEKYDNEIKAFEVEVRKIAELKKEESTWKIVDINNIKSFIDIKTDISP